jgi:fimbrial chaperone protein
MLKRVMIQAAYGLFLLVAGVSVVSAASIGVSPVRATLSANQKIETITVRNTGTEPMSVQLEVMSWSQQDGEDVFTATREVLANPPIFTVPPSGSQLIRAGLRRAPDARRELTYRIFLQELPPPPSPDFNGAKMLMRVSLPVFVLPEVAAQPALRWQAARTSDGALKISLTNIGNAHVQIANFSLSLPGSAQPWITQQSSTYVLHGQSRDWILPANAENPSPPPGAILQIFAQTDAGDMEAEVLITP